MNESFTNRDFVILSGVGQHLPARLLCVWQTQNNNTYPAYRLFVFTLGVCKRLAFLFCVCLLWFLFFGWRFKLARITRCRFTGKTVFVFVGEVVIVSFIGLAVGVVTVAFPNWVIWCVSLCSFWNWYIQDAVYTVPLFILYCVSCVLLCILCTLACC